MLRHRGVTIPTPLPSDGASHPDARDGTRLWVRGEVFVPADRAVLASTLS